MSLTEELDRLEAENAKLRAALDAAEANEPIPSTMCENLAAENRRLKAALAAAQAPEDAGPGTPLGRLKAIADFAIARGLCTGVEAKPAELFVMEALAAAQAGGWLSGGMANTPTVIPGYKWDQTLGWVVDRDHLITSAPTGAQLYCESCGSVLECDCTREGRPQLQKPAPVPSARRSGGCGGEAE